MAAGLYHTLGAVLNNRQPPASKTLLHGGDLYSASEMYGIAVEDWLDLSTGINPRSYSFRPIPQQYFERLPYLDPALSRAAKNYYQTAEILALAGSQALIEKLPLCLPPGNLWVPEIGYQEYAHQWRKQGRLLETYPSLDTRQASDFISREIEQGNINHLLIINPNNPTGIFFSVQQLKHWAKRLQANQGMLIVDEAFIDASPQHSLLTAAANTAVEENVLVLRSFGKFFGLAGLRLGFAAGSETFLAALSAKLGPWAVNGIAQQVAIQALNDNAWQQQMPGLLAADQALTEKILQTLFTHVGAKLLTSQALFTACLLHSSKAEHITQAFAQRGILIRLIPTGKTKHILRFGHVRSDDHRNIAKLTQAVESYIKS